MHSILKPIILPRIGEYRNIQGWLSDNEAVGLCIMALMTGQSKAIAEGGSWKGKSAYGLARDLRCKSVFSAVDPFDGSGEPGSQEIYQKEIGEGPRLDQFIHTMKTLGVLERINIIKNTSSAFSGQLSRIDSLFIDGDHSIESCKSDFFNFSLSIPFTGCIAFHDQDTSRKDLRPTWVIDNIVQPSGSYQFLGLFDSLWIGKKLYD